MSKRKENLQIQIDKDGNVQFEYKGVRGKKCVDATQELEVALGKVQDRQKTADYYKKDPDEPVYERRGN